jgi:hypothetical protein
MLIRVSNETYTEKLNKSQKLLRVCQNDSVFSNTGGFLFQVSFIEKIFLNPFRYLGKRNVILEI